MERIKKQKGQAAITDALFFLVIVMSLVSFLFFFNSQYGRSVGEYASSKYASDYATSALKTVLYSSFSRNSDPVESSEEIDFLVAGLKEDYAYDKEIKYFKEDLTTSVKNVMNPVRNTFDYLFFIRITDVSPKDYGQGVYTFPYFYISRKHFDTERDEFFVGKVDSEEREYYCNANNQMSQADIDSFISFVGIQGQAVSSISFPLSKKLKDSGEKSFHEGTVQIILWNPKYFEEDNSLFANLHCTQIT